MCSAQQARSGASAGGLGTRLAVNDHPFDPTAKVKVHKFASNPDFDPFTPRLSTYVKGDDDDAVAAGLIELRTLREEVTRRGKLLERHGAAKVTRKLATTVPGLHPIVIFDETHEMFVHPTHGAWLSTASPCPPPTPRTLTRNRPWTTWPIFTPCYTPRNGSALRWCWPG